MIDIEYTLKKIQDSPTFKQIVRYKDGDAEYIDVWLYESEFYKSANAYFVNELNKIAHSNPKIKTSVFFCPEKK